MKTTFNSLLISLILSLLFLGFLSEVQAQQDTRGSKDHPLIQRIPNSWIKTYKTVEFDKYALVTGPQKNYADFLDSKKYIEGKITKIAYRLPWGSKSPYAIYKNYQNAFEARKGKPLFECFEGACNQGGNLRSTIAAEGLCLHSSGDYDEKFGYYSYTFTKDAKQYYVVLMTGQFSYEESISYEIHIIELEAMKQEISLGDIEAAMEEEGKLAMYGILFETGSSVLKAESMQSIELIASYLKRHPEVSLYIVGHTDNTGSYEGNMSLSANRAKAVIQALQSRHGLSGARLQAVGVGPVAPVASNSTDDGKAQNRRVEIVLK